MTAAGDPPTAPTPLEFSTPPPLGPQYLRALIDRRPSRMPDGVVTPRLEARLAPGPAAPDALSRYESVCGFAQGDFLPITYPHVLAAGIQLRLLGETAFPVRVMGLVHVGHRIRQHRPIPRTAPLALRCWLEGSRSIDSGEEFCLHTQSSLDGELVWEEETIFIARGGGGRKRGPRRKDDDTAWETVARWAVPADTGRRYARVSGDYNPIHLTGVTGRLFGFPGAIAHGMWSLARVAAALAEADGPPACLTVRFIRPLVLPGHVELQRAAGEAFRLCSPDGRTVHLGGTTAPY
jgi:acyl dehydratase